VTRFRRNGAKNDKQRFWRAGGEKLTIKRMPISRGTRDRDVRATSMRFIARDDAA